MNYSIGEYSIIGAGGRAIDPAEYEARTMVGALDGMDDGTVIGAAAPLMIRFPGLQQTAQNMGASRVANLLAMARQQSRPMGLGAAAASAFSPGLARAEPGPVGLSLIPFQIAAVGAGATSAPIVVTPQSIFKPYKLVVDPVIAPFFLINTFTNGTVPFFDAPGAVSAAMFTSDGLPNLKKITSNPGISITLVVQNRDVVAHPFLAALYGEAAPTQCG